MKRSFLMLQGPCTPFFTRLADSLVKEAHKVHRVLFCAGDLAYWGTRPALWYTGNSSDAGEFFDDCLDRLHITDQLVFGDCRPLHRIALQRAQQRGIRSHVFEEGYFRPWWITLEQEGVNRHSRLPRDPAWFRETARHFSRETNAVLFCNSFFGRAAHDIAFHLAGIANPLLFRGYRTHALVSAPREYLGYVRRFLRLRKLTNTESSRWQALLSSGIPYFLLPLQLDGDAQIRQHSRFRNMRELIAEVLTSFSSHAPGGIALVIKNHPLDPGLDDLAAHIRVLSRQLDIEGRVHFFEEGDLAPMVSHSCGMVTANSTAGLVSLEFGRPTLALADSIYRLPGLTFPGGLDAFWRNPIAPDSTLFACFKRVVMQLTQINGGFYSRSGIDLAVSGSARSLLSQRPLQEQLC